MEQNKQYIITFKIVSACVQISLYCKLCIEYWAIVYFTGHSNYLVLYLIRTYGTAINDWQRKKSNRNFELSWFLVISCVLVNLL